MSPSPWDRGEVGDMGNGHRTNERIWLETGFYVNVVGTLWGTIFLIVILMMGVLYGADLTSLHGMIAIGIVVGFPISMAVKLGLEWRDTRLAQEGD
jgi:hypothetical protein